MVPASEYSKTFRFATSDGRADGRGCIRPGADRTAKPYALGSGRGGLGAESVLAKRRARAWIGDGLARGGLANSLAHRRDDRGAGGRKRVPTRQRRMTQGCKDRTNAR